MPLSQYLPRHPLHSTLHRNHITKHLILASCNITTGCLFGFNLAIIGQIFASILTNAAVPHEEPIETALVVSAFLLGGALGASKMWFQRSRRLEFSLATAVGFASLLIALVGKIALHGGVPEWENPQQDSDRMSSQQHSDLDFINSDLVLMIGARFGLGLALGKLSGVATLWVAELSQKDRRGSLGSLFQCSVTFGILLASFVGEFVAREQWFWAMGFQLLFGWSLMWVVACMMPSRGSAQGLESEDPAMRNDDEMDQSAILKAAAAAKRENLQLVSSDATAADTASNYSSQQQRYDASSSSPPIGDSNPIRELTSTSNSSSYSLPRLISSRIQWWKVFLGTKRYRRSLYLSLVLCFCFQLTGVQIFAYLPVIFEEAGFGVWMSGLAAIVCSLFNFFFAMIPFFSSDRFGRRPLLLTGMGLIAVSMGSLGYTSLAASEGTFRAVLTFILFIPFMLGFQIGIGCLYFVLLSELFDEEIRTTGISISNSFQWFINFACGLVFMPLVSSIGIGYLYLLFSITSVITTFNILLFLQETRGKKL